MKASIFSILVLLFAITDNTFAEQARDYYPLQVGNYWIYRSISDNGGSQRTSRMEVEGVDTIQDEEYFRMKQTLTSDDEPD